MTHAPRNSHLVVSFMLDGAMRYGLVIRMEYDEMKQEGRKVKIRYDGNSKFYSASVNAMTKITSGTKRECKHFLKGLYL